MISLPASHAHRWMECSASVHLIQQPSALPHVDTDAKREGTCASWVAECVIKGQEPNAAAMVGKSHGNGWCVDDEMAQHVQGYVDLIMSRVYPQSEVQVNVGPMRARIDGISFSLDGTTLYIDDLKYGYRVVEPEENKQLLCNMAGFLEGGVPSGVRQIVLGIYQPRSMHHEGPYRTWTIEYDQIMHWLSFTRQAIARAASDASEHVGPWCVGCRVANVCTSLVHSIYEMWDVVHGDGTIETDGPSLASELRFLERLSDILNARLTACKADAEARILKNEFVPGWGLIETYGKRQFTVDADAIEALTGIDPTVKKLCTPAELERRKANKDVVKAITTTPMIGRKLRPVTEKHIAKQFGE